MTPFERNLELWRQLWRVIERSHVVVQIVDARNPLLFRSADLENYVKEVDPSKSNVLLVNKSDLLSPEHVQKWREYFRKEQISAVFWSAKMNIVAEQEETPTIPEESDGSSETSEDEETERGEPVDGESDSDKPSASTAESKPVESVAAEVEKLEIEEDNSDIPFLHTTEELITYLKKKAFESDPDSTSVVIGMVGYPNVGKSSTINCIYGKKKTSVSATPGKTKHFQTLIIDDELTLCDCPGLVMPSFGFSSSEMVLNCILPVDRMRDFFSPVHLLCSRVPRTYFEAMYSVLLPKPAEHEDPNRPPTAHELLTTVAFMKGFMSSSGIPDCSRAARLILKDVVSGKLRWIAAPPGIPQEEFDKYSFDSLPEKKQATRTESLLLEQLEKRNLLVGHESSGKRVDKFFFKQDEGQTLIMGKILKVGRVVIVLGGRFAGRKAVVVKVYDEGATGHPYGCALVAGIDKYPLAVTKSMGKKKIQKRSHVKPFLKLINYTHLLPTRMTLDTDFSKTAVNKEALKEPKSKKKASSVIKKEFEDRYKSGKSKWFFSKLRF
jgi:large subunit GTPase 1